MTAVLIDPQPLVEERAYLLGEGHLDSRRISWLDQVTKLSRQYHLRLVPCLPIDFLDMPFKRRNNAFSILCLRLLRQSAGTAAIQSDLLPDDVPTDWRISLNDLLLNPDSWRDPMILIPEYRSAVWPTTAEIELPLGSEKIHRVVAIVERFDSHPFAANDLDPWLLRSTTSAVASSVGERRESACRLPRPPCVASESGMLRPRSEWAAALDEIRAPDCGQDDHRFFVPQRGWSPNSFDKEQWRRCEFFVRRSNDRHTGYEDRFGNIWEFDKLHNDQWDMQHPKPPDYTNVLPSGRVRGT